MGHENKCAHLHGHNYVALVTAEGERGPVDALNRVIDFSVLKERIGDWIDKQWDHGFLMHANDNAAKQALVTFNTLIGAPFTQKIFFLPYNPTAEGMARYLLEKSPSLLSGTGVRLTHVRMWETENCYADAHLEE
jgi:6-pyruvoyltetrahydropterin/6-carboxytetrahydropterin synthase